MNKIIYVTKQD